MYKLASEYHQFPALLSLDPKYFYINVYLFAFAQVRVDKMACFQKPCPTAKKQKYLRSR